MFKTGFNLKPQPGFVCVGETLTQQSFEDETNINKMMKRYKKSGFLPMINMGKPVYGDFSGVTDFAQAVTKVKEAEAAFLALPAAIRERFGHDPEKYIEFMGKEENREEAESLGLVLKKRPTPPIQVEVINPPETQKEEAGGGQT